MLPPLERDVKFLCPCVLERYNTLKDILENPEDDDEKVFLRTIETLRQKARQEHYIKIGVSWTLNSKHLAQPPRGLSLAVDVCPQDYLVEPRWNPTGEKWQMLGAAARVAGLKWGVWRRNRSTGRLENVDKAHLYLEACECD